MPRQIRAPPPPGPPTIQGVMQSTPHVPRRADPVQQQQHRPAVAALLDTQPLTHQPTWGAPTWPPPPPDARTRPGKAVARLDVDTGWLISAILWPLLDTSSVQSSHPPTAGPAGAGARRKPWATQRPRRLGVVGHFSRWWRARRRGPPSPAGSRPSSRRKRPRAFRRGRGSTFWNG